MAKARKYVEEPVSSLEDIKDRHAEELRNLLIVYDQKAKGKTGYDLLAIRRACSSAILEATDRHRKELNTWVS